MTATYLPNGEQQFIDANGAPYALGSVSYYIPNTLTPKATYQDASATILNSSPTITLDAAGRCVALGTGDYRQILHDVNGVLVWDKTVSAPLPSDAVGSAIAPCLQASTLQAFRDCAGVTTAIQSALSSVALMPGPTGPAGAASTVPGPAGAQGPTGPTGPAGVSPGGGAFLTGQATTDSPVYIDGIPIGGGQISITFSPPFASTVTILQVANPPVITGSFVGSTSISSISTSGAQVICYAGDGSTLPNTVVSWWAAGI